MLPHSIFIFVTGIEGITSQKSWLFHVHSPIGFKIVINCTYTCTIVSLINLVIFFNLWCVTALHPRIFWSDSRDEISKRWGNFFKMLRAALFKYYSLTRECYLRLDNFAEIFCFWLTISKNEFYLQYLVWRRRFLKILFIWFSFVQWFGQIMRRTLTLLIIACLLAFVAPSKQHNDKTHHDQDQHEREAHKVEHEEGSGVGSTYLESGVSGSGEGKLVLKLLRARFTFAVSYSKLSW